MIKTVIFDIGNVLAGFVWKEFYGKLGFDAEMVERLGDATVRSADWKEYDRGCLTDAQIVERFVENDSEIEAQIRRSQEDFHGLVVRWDHAIGWITELKEKGLQVLVLSNFSQKAFRECWSALDFLPYVDGGVLSYRDKLVKPMPEIYHLILSRYGLKAEECVFLDDTAENVRAAQALGIHGIVVRDHEQAKEELARMIEA